MGCADHAHIARCDREGAAPAFDPGASPKARAIRAPSMWRTFTRSRQILTQAQLHVAGQRQARFGVQRTLVKFVEQYRATPSSPGIVKTMAE